MNITGKLVYTEHSVEKTKQLRKYSINRYGTDVVALLPDEELEHKLMSDEIIPIKLASSSLCESSTILVNKKDLEKIILTELKG